MNDSGKDLKKEVKEIGDKQVQVRKIQMNEKEIEVVKLGDIAEIKVGLQTGDNNAYLFQNPEARGNYRSIIDNKEFLLTEADLDKIRNNEKLRFDVIEKGISKDNRNSERYFEGRYIIPYDKGGESDSTDGWLPNYFVPTGYFINWDEQHAKSLINQLLILKKSTTPYPRNKDFYFKVGITYSRTGNYAPTFRIGTASVFDDKSCTLFFSGEIDVMNNLAFSSSKILKFFFKNFQGHTVDAQVEDLKAISLSLAIISNSKLRMNTSEIIKAQKSNPRYDYASREQIEIDKLVYQAYGLNAEDVQEVENWHARRYSKLSAAQKANLRALGKSDDYLELYRFQNRRV